MEDSLLSIMDESTDDIEDIFQEFVETRRENRDLLIYGFFEGKDDYNYYGPRIRKYSEKEIVQYECNGKDNVLMLYSMIKKNTKALDENKLLFFIDKDFDIDNISSKEVYVTPVYSIENFYVTDSAINEFLKSQLHISKYSTGNRKKDYDKAIRYYTEERTKFIHRITLLNVWYSLQKRKSKNNNNSNKPDLSKLKSAYARQLKGEITIQKLEELTDNYVQLSQLEIKSEEKRLCSNALENFRGKYFEEFLYKTLGFIIDDANNPKQLFLEKRKVNFPIGKNNLITLLSQYADTPSCLNEYIESILMTDIDKVNKK